jgi:hypothetical protein
MSDELTTIPRNGHGLVPVRPPAPEAPPPALYQPEAQRPSDLAKALAAARDRCELAHKNARNDFHKYDYASAEEILRVAGEALKDSGLSLVDVSSEMRVIPAGSTALHVLDRHFVLIHASGESLPKHFLGWPVIPDRGRPLDKALAAALTTTLAYVYRDLLAMPRVAKGDDVSGREDREDSSGDAPPAPKRNKKPAAPPPAQPGPTKSVEPEAAENPEFLRREREALIRGIHNRLQAKGRTWTLAFEHAGLPIPEAWEEPEDADQAIIDVTEAIFPTDRLRALQPRR